MTTSRQRIILKPLPKPFLFRGCLNKNTLTLQRFERCEGRCSPWEKKFVKYNEAWRGTPQKIWGENKSTEKCLAWNDWKTPLGLIEWSWHLRHSYSDTYPPMILRFWNFQWSSRVFMHPHKKKNNPFKCHSSFINLPSYMRKKIGVPSIYWALLKHFNSG